MDDTSIAPFAGPFAPRVPAPVRRTTSATQIFEALRAEIVALWLLPGAPLQDRALVERFGVSRTPVREALIRLSEIGLVDIMPQSGTFVSRVAAGAIPEAVLVREALEGLTVEAAARIGPYDEPALRRLDLILRNQEAAAAIDDVDAFHESDEAFHAAIAAIGGHPGIWRLVMHAKLPLDRARRLTLPVEGRMQQVVREHAAIRERIAAGDPAGARAAMAAHLSSVILDVADLRRRYPGYFA